MKEITFDCPAPTTPQTMYMLKWKHPKHLQKIRVIQNYWFMNFYTETKIYVNQMYLLYLCTEKQSGKMPRLIIPSFWTWICWTCCNAVSYIKENWISAGK